MPEEVQGPQDHRPPHHTTGGGGVQNYALSVTRIGRPPSPVTTSIELLKENLIIRKFSGNHKKTVEMHKKCNQSIRHPSTCMACMGNLFKWRSLQIVRDSLKFHSKSIGIHRKHVEIKRELIEFDRNNYEIFEIH